MNQNRNLNCQNALLGKTILYLVTEDWYFWSHRLPIARAARDAGANVMVVTRFNLHKKRIEDEGFTVRHIPFDRSSLNPISDLKILFKLLRLYKSEKPDLVHHVAIKPVLYGSIAARLAEIPAVVNAMAGLGFLFISKKKKEKFIKYAFQKVFRIFANRSNTKLIVQNADDREVFLKSGIKTDRVVLVRGSGVEIDHYHPTIEDNDTPVALCVSRMLKDKGINELVEAARLLKNRNVSIKIRLVGETDANPTSIPKAQLERWVEQDLIEYSGYSDNVAQEYAHSHIAVLPSYREGLPKSLLEAAACGKPIVATDVPGCREICIDGQTGIQVPPQHIEKLADALEQLATNPYLRKTLGKNARFLVEKEFSSTHVNDLTLEIYGELLSS